MFLHGSKKRVQKRICAIKNNSILIFKQGKSLRNQGFTLFELIVVVALIAILLGVATVGISDYFETAAQLERSEIAETSFYSIQSYVNYLERHGKLDEFEEDLRSYNSSVYGSERILSESENRSIVEANYDGDGAAFYANEYYPEHKDSEIMYITLDKDRADSAHPMYDVLASALDNGETMENSFLVEYDLSTGVVRSVFYSETAGNLSYNFGGGSGDNTDCVYRDADSLVDKKQGYYGVTFTAAEVELKAQELLVPVEVNLVNEDRLYLTWAEENTNNQSFMDGTMLYEELVYTVTLYDQNDDAVAMYELPRVEMYEDITGTFAGTMDYIDDLSEPVSDILAGSTKTARIGFSDLPYTEAPNGIAGQYYYLILECLDHPFADNGYELAPETVLYATVELAYGLDGGYSAEEIVESNEESAYYAHVETELGAQEFGVACSRHLWNIRNGLYNGAYRLVADVDWTNIENRARDIDFTSTQFADANVPGFYQSFEGTFTGEKTGEEAEDELLRYSNYRINGVLIFEEENERVGLFTVNNGTIENITLSNFVISGASKTGSLAGWNMGGMKNICVLNVAVEGTEEVGGLTGYNEGTVEGCTVTTGENRIIAHHTVGGVVGYAKNSVTDCQTACRVETILLEGTDKISTSKLGRYAGGVIGYLEAGVDATELTSGLLVDVATGLPMAQKATGADGGATIVDGGVSEGEEGSGDTTETAEGTILLCSDVTAIAYMGGVIGEIEAGAGEYSNLANYAKLNVTYVDAAERTARSDSGTRMYVYYGGITGRLYAGNSLVNCTNYAVVALDFLKDGQACNPEEIFNYASAVPANNNFYNNPLYIGGITGHNKGTVQDCVSVCDDYGNFEESLEEYQSVQAKEKCYIGAYVGGLVGYNDATVLFTDALPVDTMQVVVKAYNLSNGGLVGYASKNGSIRNESGMLTMQGVVASRGSQHPQQQGTFNAFESTGGVAGAVWGGEFTGQYTNDAYVFGCNVGGITAYLTKDLTLSECNHTGAVYGRGLIYGHGKGAVGGIVGLNLGTLEECSNTGIVSGTKYMKDVPETVTNSGSFEVYVGGVAGYNTGTVINCHSNLNEEKDNYISAESLGRMGGLIGYNQQGTSSNYAGLVLTDEEEVVDIPLISGANSFSNYPTMVGGIIGAATGSLELNNFIYEGKIEVRKSGIQQKAGFGGIIGSLSEAEQLVRNCTMRGEITSKSYNNGGVVGYMTNGVIEDTVKVTKEAKIAGGSYTGGVVGRHESTAEESHVDIMENIADVSGAGYVGGIAGCVLYGQTLDISLRKNSGEILATGNYVGGLAGYYKMGDLELISGCENTGNITGINNVGGHIGGLATNAVIEECVNKASVTGESKVGGVVGNISSGGGKLTVTVNNCINEEKAEIIASVSGAGGIVGGGSCNYAAANNGALTMTQCYNYAPLDSAFGVGGMLGDMDYFVLDISDCHNYGTIGELSEGAWTVKRGAGIVGDAIADATLEDSIIKDCTQNANVYNVASTAYTHGIGGMGGNLDINIRVENCHWGDTDTSYRIESSGKAHSFGGIVGDSIKRLTVINCDSNVDMFGVADGYYFGGIVGYAKNLQVGAAQNDASYCDAYGDIQSETLLQYSGGIVGTVYNADFEINGSTYYGTIGKNTAKVTYVGGILGYANIDVAKIATGMVQDCTQQGQIYNASSIVGGIIGQNTYHDTTVLNCHNGVENITDSGNIYGVAVNANNIGGLIGGLGPWGNSKSVERFVYVKNSHNYGDLYFENNATRIGGLVGYNTLSLIIGDEEDSTLTCYNYGTIDGKENVTLTNVGGAMGYGGNYVIGSTYFYDVINYADIGENVTAVTTAGGIVGNTAKNGLLKNCTNLGQILNVTGAATGGIVGYAYSVTEFSLVQCTNGKQDDDAAGLLDVNGSFLSIGGLVGRIGNDSKTLTGNWNITDCVNYGKLQLDGTGYWVGGICGIKSTPAELHIENTVNYGEINTKSNFVRLIGGILGYGSLGTVSVGAPLEDETTNPAKVCVNYGKIRFTDGASGNRVGGILGDCTNASVYGAVNEADITYDDTSMVAGIGGIAGYLSGTTLLQDCRQKGVLYYKEFAEASASGRNPGAGGMASRIVGTAIILRCENGSEEARTAGEIDGSILVDSILTADSATCIGGIFGRSYANLYMEECYNYADFTIMTTSGTVMGGICGGTGGDETILSCDNFGDIAAEGSLSMTGGIIGYTSYGSTVASNVTRIGDLQDRSRSCNNYGDILPGDGSSGERLGGIIGESNRPVEIYGSQNYGNIGKDSADSPQLKYTAGIVGKIKASYPAVIANCTQNAKIYQALQYIGGIAGSIESETTITGCANGIYEDAETGNIYGINAASYIGGIAGYGSALTVENSKNYRDIYVEGTISRLGGILGSGKNITIGSEDVAKACINYGNIYGTTKETVLGGIVGGATLSVSILNCVNEGNVGLGNGTSTNSSVQIGGIAGIIGDSNTKTTVEILVKGCTNNGDLLFGRQTDASVVPYQSIGGISSSVYGGVDANSTLVEGCINNGTIGTVAYVGSGQYIGGITGGISGTMRNCVNNGDIYAGHTYIGGVTGIVLSQTSIGNIESCTNNGNIKLAHKAEYVGGICGYSTAHNYDKDMIILNCVNVGDITLKEGVANKYIGGIFGYQYTSNNRMVNLEITESINKGNISYGYMYVGGVIGSTAYFNKCIVSNSANIGDIQAQNRIGAANITQLGFIGGVAGAGDRGTFYGCINAGDINGTSGRVGGITGTSGSRSIINCYNVGKVNCPLTVFASIGDTIGQLTNSPYIVDCYSYHNIAGKQIGDISDTAVHNSFWQAESAGGMDGYLDATAYATLCNLFGVNGSLDASSKDTLYASVKLLADNYKYDPQAPVTSNFVYTPADETVADSVATISFDIAIVDYFMASGMELRLYEATMTDEEMMADVEGNLAFYYNSVEFSNGQLPASIQLEYPDANLPDEETEYKVKIRTLGYSDSLGTVFTKDTDWMIVSDETITLPASSTTEGDADGSTMSVPDEEDTLEEETTEDESIEEESPVEETTEEETSSEEAPEEETTEEETSAEEETTEEESSEEISSEEDEETDDGSVSGNEIVKENQERSWRVASASFAWFVRGQWSVTASCSICKIYCLLK